MMAALLAACSGKPASAPSAAASAAPVIELSSPDQALKSWWRVRDQNKRYESERCAESVHAFKDSMAGLIKQVATGPALNEIADIPGACAPEVIERTILKVEVETETRAVAYALLRVNTPPPAAITLTAEEVASRKKGERYKYVLEKVEGDWKVAQVYSLDLYPGSDDPWRQETRDSTPRYILTNVYGLQ